ncbi:DUF3566 domain-containing protein [Streptosporangium sp. NPDC050855]|uniref:DUF3566 domain-containing protein n=1 Tax=Streptosporangium sp. NPDC050855 TaxID=3366194 RepID=UPI0037898459
MSAQGKPGSRPAASRRDQAMEKMDKTAEAGDVETASPQVNGGSPAPGTEEPAADAKGRKKVSAADDGKQAETTVRIRPGSSPSSPPSSPPSSASGQARPSGQPPRPSGPGGPPPRSSAQPSAPSQPSVAPPSSPSSSSQQAGQQNRAAWSPGSMSSSSPSPDGSGRKAGDAPAPRAPRKAHLVLRRIEPWSAMKFSFVVSLVCFVVLFIAVAVLYMVLSGLGVFENIIQLVNQLTVADGKSTSGIDVASWFEPVRILGYTALIGAVNVVLITALSTLGAVIYNVASDLVGGVEVTFSEAE